MVISFFYDNLLFLFFQITCGILCISLLTVVTPTPRGGQLKFRQNILLVLLSLEIAIAALCFLSLIYSVYVPNLFGSIIIVVLLVLAGVESALGLALIMLIFRVHGLISFDKMGSLKG